jgi:predicted nucleic acid-binding protein
MIVAAAEKAGCARILSEDLSAGQTYFGVRVENPFL